MACCWQWPTEITRFRYGIARPERLVSPTVVIVTACDPSPGHLMAHRLLLPATILRCIYGTQRQVITSSPIAVIPTGRQQWRGHLMDYVLPRQAMTGQCMSGKSI